MSLTLSVEDLSSSGQGVARHENFVFFVEGGIPGQKVSATIRRLKKTYGEAVIDEILEESPHRIDPPCPYFGTCGGCRYQHISYTIQAQSKLHQVEDALERIGGVKHHSVEPILPAEEVLGYRNKMEFTFSDRRWFLDKSDAGDPNFALGLHVPRRFDKVLDIDGCLLQSSRMNEAFRVLKTAIKKTELPPYSVRSHTGYWRFLVLRGSSFVDDLMVNIITSSQEGESGTKVVREIADEVSQNQPITTFIHSITDRKGQVAFGESLSVLTGSGAITEKIGESRFEISPDAFFQTNSHQAQLLFQTIAELADLQGDETVYDLYCGTGAIGLFLAQHTKRIIGIEVIESALQDAQRNSILNGCKNIEFVHADMKDALGETNGVLEGLAPPDVIILDPPRGGTHPKTVTGLLRIKAPVIVYVSCNPAILARDIAILCEEAYTLQRIQPIDMFPQTPHVEVVAKLVLKRFE